MTTYGYEELSSASPIQAVHLCVPLPHPGKQIRVLDLDTVGLSSPTTAPVLHGRLRVLSELKDEQYSALSYVWAQEDPGTTQRENRLVIHCDSHQHQARLGPNCWSALWHLSKIKGPLTIWVDAICINQKHDEEKIPQIALMRNVYTLAQTTYFWLGEASKGTDKAMDYLLGGMISRDVGQNAAILRITVNILIRIMTFRVYPHHSGLKEIFSRSWIDRLWTLQECLLSRQGVIVCGEKSISWLDFVCALESIHYFRTHPWSIRFDDMYLPWLNLANLSRWFTEDTENPSNQEQLRLNRVLEHLNLCGWLTEHIKTLSHLEQLMLNRVLEHFNQPAPMVQAHLNNIKWATRLVFILLSVTSLLNPNPSFLFLPLALLLFILRKSRPKNIGLFFPTSQHSIMEELRRREVGDPKDVYNGMVGILGDDASNPQECLQDVYRRLCASLIHKTQSLDILLFANNCPDNNCCSWVIDWNSETPQLWGKALYFMGRHTSRDLAGSAHRVNPRTEPGNERDPFKTAKSMILRIYNKVLY